MGDPSPSSSLTFAAFTRRAVAKEALAAVAHMQEVCRCAEPGAVLELCTGGGRPTPDGAHRHCVRLGWECRAKDDAAWRQVAGMLQAVAAHSEGDAAREELAAAWLEWTRASGRLLMDVRVSVAQARAVGSLDEEGQPDTLLPAIKYSFPSFTPSLLKTRRLEQHGGFERLHMVPTPLGAVETTLNDLYDRECRRVWEEVASSPPTVSHTAALATLKEWADADVRAKQEALRSHTAKVRYDAQREWQAWAQHRKPHRSRRDSDPPPPAPDGDAVFDAWLSRKQVQARGLRLLGKVPPTAASAPAVADAVFCLGPGLQAEWQRWARPALAAKPAAVASLWDGACGAVDAPTAVMKRSRASAKTLLARDAATLRGLLDAGDAPAAAVADAETAVRAAVAAVKRACVAARVAFREGFPGEGGVPAPVATTPVVDADTGEEEDMHCNASVGSGDAVWVNAVWKWVTVVEVDLRAKAVHVQPCATVSSPNPSKSAFPITRTPVADDGEDDSGGASFLGGTAAATGGRGVWGDTVGAVDGGTSAPLASTHKWLPLHTLVAHRSVVVRASSVDGSGPIVAFRAPPPDPRWGVALLRSLMPPPPPTPPPPPVSVDPSAYRLKDRRRMVKAALRTLPSVARGGSFEEWREVGAALYTLAPLALEKTHRVAAFEGLNAAVLDGWCKWTKAGPAWGRFEALGCTDTDMWDLCARHWAAFGGVPGDTPASCPGPAVWDRAWGVAQQGAALLKGWAGRGRENKPPVGASPSTPVLVSGAVEIVTLGETPRQVTVGLRCGDDAVREPWFVLQMNVGGVFHTAHSGPDAKCHLRGLAPGGVYGVRAVVVDVADVDGSHRAGVMKQVAGGVVSHASKYHLCSGGGVPMVDTLDVPPQVAAARHPTPTPRTVPWATACVGTVAAPPAALRILARETVLHRHWVELGWAPHPQPLTYHLQVRCPRGAPADSPAGASRMPPSGPPPGGVAVGGTTRPPVDVADGWPSTWVTVYAGERHEVGVGWFHPGEHVQARVAAVGAGGALGPWSPVMDAVLPRVAAEAPTVSHVSPNGVELRWPGLAAETPGLVLGRADHPEPHVAETAAPAPAPTPTPTSAPTVDDAWYPHWHPTERATYWFQPSTGRSSWDPASVCPAPRLVPEDALFREVWSPVQQLCYFVNRATGVASWRAPPGVGCPSGRRRGGSGGHRTPKLSLSASMVSFGSQPREASPAAPAPAPAPPMPTTPTATLGTKAGDDGPYRLQQQGKAGWHHVWEGRETVAVVLGLLPNTLNKFRVQTRSTRTKTVTVLTLPLPPCDLHVARLRPSNVDLAWEAPSGGAAKFRLVVTRGEGREGDVVYKAAMGGDYRGCRVGGLVNSATYTVRLWAVNAGGSLSVEAAVLVVDMPRMRPK